MAKQTFTTGQVLTAAQMTSLQQTAMGGGAASAKTASYVLVAADAGTAITMTSGSATTITVNTGLFSAGDSVQIINLGAGTCTITAGTASVSTAGSLILSQYESGFLYFTATGTAIFNDYVQAGGGGKVLQVVGASTTTYTASSTSTFIDTGLTASITPSATSSKVLVLLNQNEIYHQSGITSTDVKLFRGATQIAYGKNIGYNGTSTEFRGLTYSVSILDTPATTSSTTYKTQFCSAQNTGTVSIGGDAQSTLILLEIGA